MDRWFGGVVEGRSQWAVRAPETGQLSCLEMVHSKEPPSWLLQAFPALQAPWGVCGSET
jgi:hypothetical protein